jgi:hypothetical protein
MLELLLPKPSDNLLNYVKQLSLETPINEINISRRQKFIDCNIGINVALSSYPKTELLDELVRQEYNNFLNLHENGIHPSCLLMQNLIKAPCFIPPHTDIGRTVAINYIIFSGGNEVKTTFYKNYSIDPDGSTSYYSDETLEIEKSYELNDNKWYAFDPRQCHSVDNIHDKRLLLSISIYRQPFIRFKELYKHLIYREF